MKLFNVHFSLEGQSKVISIKASSSIKATLEAFALVPNGSNFRAKSFEPAKGTWNGTTYIH